MTDTRKVLERANELMEWNPYPRYTYVAQNAAVELERAEKYARSLLVLAFSESAINRLTTKPPLNPTAPPSNSAKP